MANHKFKRSVKSSQRGRGKNHSVNAKRSYIDMSNYSKAAHKKRENNRKRRAYSEALRMLFAGVAIDMREAVIIAYKRL